MEWLDNLRTFIEEYNASFTREQIRDQRLHPSEREALDRKLKGMMERNAVIVNAKVKAKILESRSNHQDREVTYLILRTYLIKQNQTFYVEESMEKRRAILHGDEIRHDEGIHREGDTNSETLNLDRDPDIAAMPRYNYNRLEAVKYAETWWNSHNPAYRLFENDCTNFISQCLRAGGAPMRGHPNRSKGWWYSGSNWSYSWAVANTLRWYLSGSKQGLRGEEVGSPEQLMLGDVICYDFDGDGRWQHNTMVVAKDDYGMPLVNAHTYNSRMRYWEYTDSSAYTPKIKYKFFRIVDG